MDWFDSCVFKTKFPGYLLKKNIHAWCFDIFCYNINSLKHTSAVNDFTNFCMKKNPWSIFVTFRYILESNRAWLQDAVLVSSHDKYLSWPKAMNAWMYFESNLHRHVLNQKRKIQCCNKRHWIWKKMSKHRRSNQSIRCPKDLRFHAKTLN